MADYAFNKLSSAKEYVLELVCASYSAITTKEDDRYERVALAYHGFVKDSAYLVNRLHPNVYTVQHRDLSNGMMAKRISPQAATETYLLRLLSSSKYQDPRNHTVFPTAILWQDRITISPIYYQPAYISPRPPNFVLDVAKQLTEAVSFLHDKRIAHLDINLTNVLLAVHSTFKRPRLLLMDFEMSRAYSATESPTTDVWWLDDEWRKPPEGVSGINAFAFDMFCVGSMLRGIAVEDYSYRKRFLNVRWPPTFIPLLRRMTLDDPSARPTAKQAEDILRPIDEDQEIIHEGPHSKDRYIVLACSLADNPTMSTETLPVPLVDSLGIED